MYKHIFFEAYSLAWLLTKYHPLWRIFKCDGKLTSYCIKRTKNRPVLELYCCYYKTGKCFLKFEFYHTFTCNYKSIYKNFDRTKSNSLNLLKDNSFWRRGAQLSQQRRKKIRKANNERREEWKSITQIMRENRREVKCQENFKHWAKLVVL